MTGRAMGSHQSAKMITDEWFTPPGIIKPLGEFDLDPCTHKSRPWNTAKKHYTVLDDGFNSPWKGRVWLNPPYGLQARDWMRKLSEHGNGIALLFSRLETKMFFYHVWPKADAILHIQGRLHFYHLDGTRAKANAGAPSCLIAYGEENVKALENCGIGGSLNFITDSRPNILII